MADGVSTTPKPGSNGPDGKGGNQGTRSAPKPRGGQTSTGGKQ